MAEKSEQPTAKRLRDARQQGDVCKSQDVPSALCVIVVVFFFMLFGPLLFETLYDMMNETLLLATTPYNLALPRIGEVVLYGSLKIVMPLVLLVSVMALIGNVMQVGVMFSVHSIVPKLGNLDPANWFRKVFSMRNAADFIKNIIKVVVLSIAVWQVLEKYLPLLIALQQGTKWDMWTVLGNVMMELLLVSSIVFCIIAIVDYIFQRWHYNKEHRMTKDEVRREFKDMEGDPQIKGKRKQLHRELLSQNALDSVRRAKVLVTNPTHFAVALDYEKGRTPLPVVLAKGEGLLAQRMIEVAKQEGIPIMRNVPLARDLYDQGTENACIPQELIGPVAEVLRWVQSLQKNG